MALERVPRARQGEIGLAGARGTDREGDIVLEDILDVLPLPRRAAVQVRPPGEKRRVLLRSAAGANFDQAELYVVYGEAALCGAVKFLQHLGCPGRLGPAQSETLAAPRDPDIQRRLH